MSGKKINLKTIFKYILENIFRKNANFGKCVPKIMRVKLDFQGELEETLGGRKEKFPLIKDKPPYH
jgi:hypothetical protein